MPISDAERRLQELEALFSALAHPARRQILLTVWFRGGELGSGEITARFAHAWPTTVRHLRVLEEAGLLSRRKSGRMVIYRVNMEKLDLVREWLAWFDPERQDESVRRKGKR
jgi:DNA-binding transcriptional ArsR family regulator